MSDYTNVLELLTNHINQFKAALSKEGKLTAEPWLSLVDQIHGILDLLNQPGIGAPLDNYQLEKISPIDKYGAASLVVALYEDNVELKLIAKQLEGQLGVIITEGDVKSWLTNYAQAPITSKVDLLNGSVFDTQTQLQGIFDTLHTLLEEVEVKDDENFRYAKVVKEEVKLNILKEVRMAIKDGAALATTIANMQNIENFKKIVIEAVNKENPATAQRIWKQIREAKITMNTLNM